jgi:hypothetical protein
MIMIDANQLARIQSWVSFVPLGGVFIGMRQCQNGAFCKRRTDDLQPNRESVAGLILCRRGVATESVRARGRQGGVDRE